MILNSFFLIPYQAHGQGCCGSGCGGCYNWPTTLTFRIIWLVHDLAYFIIYSLNGYWTRFDIVCTALFLIALGIGIGIIVAFSKFPKKCCCSSNETFQTQALAVGGQPQPIQVVQQLPNGQLVVVQNPNLGINNPNYVIVQQPQVIPISVSNIQQSAVAEQNT